MPEWLQGLSTAAELIAYFAIALLAALATVYAIAVSLMKQQLLRASRAREEMKRLSADAERKFASTLEEAKKSTSNPEQAIAELNAKWASYKSDQEAKIRPLIQRDQRLSLGHFMWLPGGLLVAGFALEVTTVVVVRSDVASRLAAPLLGLGVLCIAVAARQLALSLSELSLLAREPVAEEPDVRSLLQTLATALDLKPQEYEVLLYAGDHKQTSPVALQTGVDKVYEISVHDGSKYPVRDCVLEMILPVGIELKKRGAGLLQVRPATMNPYPGGVGLTVNIGLLSSALRAFVWVN